ncbi:MAG: class I SAM-dependent methyltransferase [Methanomicrobiales archaeon]|nr:class I SAM-dependent methyltransferase [Methanomicrobiales archaeon]
MASNVQKTVVKERMRRYFSDIFLSVLRSNAKRVMEEKMACFESPEIFQTVDMKHHFTHLNLEEEALQNVVQGLIIDRLRFIKISLGSDGIERDSFADIGDPNGIFVQALKKKGISANISESCVRNIASKGLRVVRCDAEYLPFKEASLDHILFFEILEHLPNPIRALDEISRVCRKSAFISLPSVSKTLIHRYHYDTSVPPFENHIFEFSDADFRKIVSHTGFRIKRAESVDVIDSGTALEYPIFLLWKILRLLIRDPEYPDNPGDLFMGCFKRFQLYHLVKKGDKRVAAPDFQKPG